eukprot:scaffold1483_cov379-Prasinococcus_capsulatus_cf.AAC.19
MDKGLQVLPKYTGTEHKSTRHVRLGRTIGRRTVCWRCVPPTRGQELVLFLVTLYLFIHRR